MPTPQQLKAADIYAQIMEEIKIRISAIDAGTSGLLINLAPLIVREHCYLQLRMICELIALGCLVAHGDIKDTQASKLQKAWSADLIMEELAKLHPDFYPYPATQVDRSHINAINPSPLPRSELLSIYRRCGDLLHRGSVRKLMSRKTSMFVNYSEITALAQKLLNLLNVHMVLMQGGETVFICMLHNKDNNNRVQVAIGERGVPPAHVLESLTPHGSSM